MDLTVSELSELLLFILCPKREITEAQLTHSIVIPYVGSKWEMGSCNDGLLSFYTEVRVGLNPAVDLEPYKH